MFKLNKYQILCLITDLMTQPAPPVIHVAEPGEIGEEFKKENEKVKAFPF